MATICREGASIPLIDRLQDLKAADVTSRSQFSGAAEGGTRKVDVALKRVLRIAMFNDVVLQRGDDLRLASCCNSGMRPRGTAGVEVLL